jgi:hypothetical protein
LTNAQNYNETPQPAAGIAGYIFNGLNASKTESDSFESWIATLTKLAEQHEREARVTRDAEPAGPAREVKAPLPKLEAGPWRSLGGYFDYTHWADRERFLELDKAIAASQDLRESEMERDIEMVWAREGGSQSGRRSVRSAQAALVVRFDGNFAWFSTIFGPGFITWEKFIFAWSLPFRLMHAVDFVVVIRTAVSSVSRVCSYRFAFFRASESRMRGLETGWTRFRAYLDCFSGDFWLILGRVFDTWEKFIFAWDSPFRLMYAVDFIVVGRTAVSTVSRVCSFRFVFFRMAEGGMKDLEVGEEWTGVGICWGDWIEVENTVGGHS